MNQEAFMFAGCVMFFLISICYLVVQVQLIREKNKIMSKLENGIEHLESFFESKITKDPE